MPADYKSTYPTHRDTPNHPGDSRPDSATPDSVKPTPATRLPNDTNSTPETDHSHFTTPKRKEDA